MSFIKRFESISIDEDLESCKDIIETLVEYEDDIEASSFKEGYYDGRDVKSKMESENTPKALQFYLEFKGSNVSRWGNSKGDIIEKSDFDKSILLIQRAKYLYSKFQLYCSNIIVEIKYRHIQFVLLFENKDESEKRAAKIQRIYKFFKDHFGDYSSNKTFYIGSKNSKEYLPIVNDIKKNDVRFEVIRDIEFRFTTDINLKNDVITIRPKTFRYKVPYIENNWKPLKSNKNLISFVSKELSKKMVKGYNIEKSNIIENINVTIDNGTIFIKIK